MRQRNISSVILAAARPKSKPRLALPRMKKPEEPELTLRRPHTYAAVQHPQTAQPTLAAQHHFSLTPLQKSKSTL
jgi:hypothetical protein